MFPIRLLPVLAVAAACGGCVIAPVEPVPVAGAPVYMAPPPPLAVVPAPYYLGPPPVTYGPYYAPAPVIRGQFWSRPHWHGRPGGRPGGHRR